MSEPDAAGFVFTPEMGARLRELRRAAGLSLRGLAERTGRTCRGAATPFSQLELGRVRNPSLGLVVDYLRACGAGPEALASVLGPLPDLLPPVGECAAAMVAALTRGERLEQVAAIALGRLSPRPGAAASARLVTCGCGFFRSVYGWAGDEHRQLWRLRRAARRAVKRCAAVGVRPDDVLEVARAVAATVKLVGPRLPAAPTRMP